MSTELTTKLSFKDKLLERIKNSVGELMTDEDLFERRKIQDGYYGSSTKEVPSIVDEAVQKYLKEAMDRAVDKWIAENPEAFSKAVSQVIQEGIANAITQSFERKMASGLYQLQLYVDNNFGRKSS